MAFHSLRPTLPRQLRRSLLCRAKAEGQLDSHDTRTVFTINRRAATPFFATPLASHARADAEVGGLAGATPAWPLEEQVVYRARRFAYRRRRKGSPRHHYYRDD